jgi:hypothetical protein
MRTRWSAILSRLLLINSLSLSAQVVNIEQARVNADSIGWQANIDLSYFRQEFDDDLTTITGRFSAQKKDSKVYLLILADAGYSYSQEDVFTNYKLGHVRASVKVAPRVRWEGFAQVQDNKPLGIQFRSLVGTGPRVRLLMKDQGRLYGGTTAMIENEWSTSGIKDHWVLRSSNYLNFSWSKGEKYGLSSTLYYQPRFTSMSDYRVSGQHTLLYAFSKKLNGKLEFTHYYDSMPPSEGLNRSRITTLGLSYVLE